uniref:uncharacterized protein LOC122603790 n=1 Tax=Erigeron canadensis TaxID=72917 RepID=UPI001CB9C8E6|nr:uncharacterized protein LOC122603790 [Erigeron canadensis]
MALLTFPSSSETHKIHQPTHHTKMRKQHHQQKPNPNPNPKPIPKSKPNPKPKSKSKSKPKPEPKQQNQSSSSSSSSWDQFKNLLTCKQMDVVGSNKVNNDPVNKNPNNNNYSKLSSCSSICSFRDVVHGNTRVVHRADNSPESSSTTTTSTNAGLDFGLLSNRKKQQMSHDQIMGRRHHGSSSNSSKTLTTTGSVRSNNNIVHGSTNYTSCSRGMQFRKLSGCYECHAIVDPSRYTIPRSTICVCSQCGEVFPKMESLEHHQAVRHAVSELGSDDSGRNIVEIIFKSSWLKKDHPIFTIERILKVHNTSRTIQRFEDCRDAVKSRATATTTASRRAADGNELLRFHCTTLACSLGARNSSTLCSAIPGCGVCTVIRYGFQNPKCGGIGAGGDGGAKGGVRTSASSGRAHDCLGIDTHGRRAMLVCRVIAGKVKRVAEGASPDEDGPYDSVAGNAGLYSNLEELYVYNPRAILPCFVVIYKALES